MLAVPAGGRVEAAAAPAPRLDRVETAVCYAGRAAPDVGESLAASLAAAGWRDVVVEPHPTIAGRYAVRDVRDGDGARLSIGIHDVPAGAQRRFAGPPASRARRAAGIDGSP